MTTPAATTTLGDGLVVSAQGYGAMSLTDVYGPVDDEQALATATAAVDAGATFVDTANLYGGGRSERILSRLLATRRDEIVLASKFGIVPGDGIGKRGVNGRPEYVREQIDLSLGRLGVETIDLYYQHRPDPSVPVEETVGAMAELVAAGKVRHLGLSEPSADDLRRAAAVHPIAAVQSEWSLVSRDVERTVVPAAIEVGAGFVPYSPLSRGLLTDGFDPAGIGEGDGRRNFPRFWDEHLPANLLVRERLVALAAEAGVPAAQLALAWLQQRAAALGVPSVAIPGSRSADRVRENLGALTLTVGAELQSELDALADAVSGPRSADPAWTSAGHEPAVP